MLQLELLAAAALLAAPAVSRADVHVESTAAAPLAGAAAHFVSPRGAHVACVAVKDGRTVVVFDGAEGPKLDRLLETSGAPAGELAKGPTAGPRTGVIVFSADGEHFAYAGQQGTDAVVVLDGKESGRVPFVPGMFSRCPLQFSPKGKHFFYVIDDGKPDSHPRFVLDGAVSPFLPSSLPPADPAGIAFSPDDSRYAFLGTNPEKPGASALVVDGKDCGYLAESPRFAGDGRHLLTLRRLEQEQDLLADGHPIVRTRTIGKVCIPPAGDRVAAILSAVDADGLVTSYLVVDGRRVEDSLCLEVRSVVFSPDGKRYAACCRGQSGEQQWMVVDGHRGESFTSIPSPEEIVFSRDSSKVAYRASSEGTWFVVVNGVKSEAGNRMPTAPFFSPAGSRLAFLVPEDGGRTRAVIDGKALEPRLGVENVVFSANGSHYAFLFGPAGAAGSPRSLAVDGVERQGFAVLRFLLSPDGAHVETVATRAKDGLSGMFVDEQLVCAPGDRVSRETFTPDGRHLFWLAAERPAPDAEARPVVYADGKPVVRFDAARAADFSRLAESWEMGADGVLTVLGASGDSVRRLRITPDPDSSIATMIAGAAAAAGRDPHGK